MKYGLSGVLGAGLLVCLLGFAGCAPNSDQNAKEEKSKSDSAAVKGASMMPEAGAQQDAAPGSGQTQEQAQAPSRPARIYEVDEWLAWTDLEPGGPATLHVKGNVKLGHPAYELELVYHTPQGINPAILMLDLVITEKEGPHTEVLTWHEVSYEVPSRNGQYTDVHVLTEAKGEPIPVLKVQAAE